MSTTECGVCGKAHPTSECVNLTIQYECPCCDCEESKVKEKKCVCPACERQLACKEEEFKATCKQPPVCVPEIKIEDERDCFCEQSYPDTRPKNDNTCIPKQNNCPPCPCPADECIKSKSQLDLDCNGREKKFKECFVQDPCKLCQLEKEIDRKVASTKADRTAEKRRCAEEKRQEEIERLEKQRRCEEEKCIAEKKKDFMDECIKEQMILQEKRRAELEKCRELEKKTKDDCTCVCEEKQPTTIQCEVEEKSKFEQCNYDSTENLKLQCSKVTTCPTDNSNNCGKGSVIKENIDCPQGAEKFAKCVAKCASEELDDNCGKQVASSNDSCNPVRVKKENQC